MITHKQKKTKKNCGVTYSETFDFPLIDNSEIKLFEFDYEKFSEQYEELGKFIEEEIGMAENKELGRIIVGIRCYSANDLVKILNLALPKIKKYIKQGYIKALKLGKEYIIAEPNLQKFLNESHTAKKTIDS